MRGSRGNRNKKDKKVTGFIWMLLVVLVLCGIALYATAQVKTERDEKLAQKQELEHQIAIQKEESERLEVRKEFTGTRRFVEEMARKVLGLVYPDEIVFEEEKAQK